MHIHCQHHPLQPDPKAPAEAVKANMRAVSPSGVNVRSRKEWSMFCTWPCGLMDKALVFGTKDCRFESCSALFPADHFLPQLVCTQRAQRHPGLPRLPRPTPDYPGCPSWSSFWMSWNGLGYLGWPGLASGQSGVGWGALRWFGVGWDSLGSAGHGGAAHF